MSSNPDMVYDFASSTETCGKHDNCTEGRAVRNLFAFYSTDVRSPVSYPSAHFQGQSISIPTCTAATVKYVKSTAYMAHTE